MLLLGDLVLADVTAFRLRLLGYQTQRPASTHDAQSAIVASLPSLLLLDTKIGEEEGLPFLSKIRRDHDATRLPVMILTLDPSLDTVRMAHQSGAQDYLISPFDPTVLEAKVARLLNVDNFFEPHSRSKKVAHASVG